MSHINSAAAPSPASSTSTSTSASASPSPAPSVVFVTGNAKKLAETKAILADVIPDLQSLDIDVPELQGPDAVSVTRAKAIAARALSPYPILVEDTSLCFTALNSLPGPYIKWFLSSLGHDGLVRLLAGHTDHTAYAQCVFAYVQNVGDTPILFDGRCPGRIVPARQGSGEPFGWDPIFQPDEGGGKTFAEMEKEQKHRISHRGRALALVKEFFALHPEVLGDVRKVAEGGTGDGVK